MGADLSFYKDDIEFYFRDSYNETNLAWIADLSYWSGPQKKKGQIKFMKKLADITDEKIKDHVHKLFAGKKNNIAKGETEEDWIKMFKEKRDDVKKNLSIIETADKIVWSI